MAALGMQSPRSPGTMKGVRPALFRTGSVREMATYIQHDKLERGLWPHGPKGQRAKGPKGQRAKGPKGQRAKGPKGQRAKGPADLEQIHPLQYGPFEPMDHGFSNRDCKIASPPSHLHWIDCMEVSVGFFSLGGLGAEAAPPRTHTHTHTQRFRKQRSERFTTLQSPPQLGGFPARSRRMPSMLFKALRHMGQFRPPLLCFTKQSRSQARPKLLDPRGPGKRCVHRFTPGFVRTLGGPGSSQTMTILTRNTYSSSCKTHIWPTNNFPAENLPLAQN